MAVTSSLSTVIELLWRRGIAVSAICYLDGHIALLVQGGHVRFLPFDHVRYPSQTVAETVASGLPRCELSHEPPRDGKTVVEISPHEMAWWQFLRRLVEQRRIQA